MALGRAAIDVTPDKVAEVRAGDGAPDRAAQGRHRGRERGCMPASGVTSMWLDNGVRAHHRFMDERKNEASIAITLAGGDDPGDGGGPRPHRGGAARLGPPGDEHAVEHGDPRSDDGGEGAGAQRDERATR